MLREELLQSFILHDAYAGYRKLEEEGVTLALCWSHMRRKFDEVLKALKKDERKNALANIGLQYCNRLFELERKFDDAGLNFEERKKQRKLHSKPVADAFFAWAKKAHGEALPKNRLGVALTYAVNQHP